MAIMLLALSSCHEDEQTEHNGDCGTNDKYKSEILRHEHKAAKGGEWCREHIDNFFEETSLGCQIGQVELERFILCNGIGWQCEERKHDER